jgi:hypothetical protein
LKREFETAGTEVIRDLLSSSSTGVTPNNNVALRTSDDKVTQLWLQLKAFDDRVSRQLTDMQAGIEQIRYESEQSAFIAGLIAAYNAGWQPDAGTMAPITLDSKFVDAFQAFVKSQQGTGTLPKA